MKELYELKDKLSKELENYSRKDITASTLTMVDTLAHALKNLDKVIEKCEEEEEQYSNDGGSMRGSYGYSRRMYSRDGYSGDDDVTMELQDLMRNAPDERTRQKIQTILNRM